jgi:hypothetical protein
MRSWLFSLTLAIVVGVSIPAQAGHTQKYFPLKVGNTWKYRWEGETPQETEERVSTVVQKKGTLYKLSGFPGAHPLLWVRSTGHTLRAWDSLMKKWMDLFRFGAPVGTEYGVFGASVPLFLLQGKYKVAEKGLALPSSALGRTLKGCIRFTVWRPFPANGILTGFVFAPKVGLIQWTSMSLSQPSVATLVSATVAGQKLGFVDFSSLGKGIQSKYKATSVGWKNKVLLFNTKAEWKAFYKQHAPGQTAPPVDFSKKTVLVALAGFRPSGGFNVSVLEVRWTSSVHVAHVRVGEKVTGGSAISIATFPFQIVVLKEKVQGVTVKWDTSLPPPPVFGPNTP